MRTGVLGAVALALTGALARAEPRPGVERADTSGDRFQLVARSNTYATLFRRALLPGPDGAVVQTDTVAPLYEYITVHVEGLNAPWRRDSIGLEFSGWIRVFPVNATYESKLAGDVQTAFVRYHDRTWSLRLGRQQYAGGAARFARFDGASVAVESAPGFYAAAYGGMTVLPRWEDRVGYHHLGADLDVLVRDPRALDTPERSGHWLAGAQLGYRSSWLMAAASFHEQRESGELGRRNLGLEARLIAARAVELGSGAVLEADARRLADARSWLDWRPSERVSLSLEHQHTEPALWLSRQSVLAVFSTTSVDEGGATAALGAARWLTLEGAAFATLYEGDRWGGRGEGVARLTPDHRTAVRVGYARVRAATNGYHSVRASVSRRLFPRTSATGEVYGYFYDAAISGYRTSSFYALTLGYDPARAVRLLWGGSVARTPYAALDAQTLLRVSCEFDGAVGGDP